MNLIHLNENSKLRWILDTIESSLGNSDVTLLLDQFMHLLLFVFRL